MTATKPTTDLATITFTELDRVCGGVLDYAPTESKNEDSSWQLGKGYLGEGTTKKRTDDAYRLDVIKQSCERKFTDENGKVDRPKAEDCLLEKTR